MNIALVAGGTGLIGGTVLRLLVEEAGWESVVSLARRRIGWEHPKLEERLIDYERLGELGPLECSAIFCGLGTTLKKAGSKRAFRRVDLGYVRDVAAAARHGGASQLLLVSSVGADPKARNFYLSVKGEAETAVAEVGFESIRIFRPSLLLGERLDSRPLERLGTLPARMTRFLMLGPLERYRAVPAETVAAALVVAAREPVAGVHIHTHRDIRRLASRLAAGSDRSISPLASQV